MKIKDRVYGDIEITEPVVLEVINSQALERLKHIEQSGYYEPFFTGTTFKRFEHSVGVYWLLKIRGASLPEQLAGLIHDVSHGAFSHCIDYALSGGSEKEHSHQDNIHDEFVYKSDIPNILKKYNFDLDYILDDKNFPLKETTLPNLCADRIDYSLRTAVAFNKITQLEAEKILSQLQVADEKWYFVSFSSAKQFTDLFEELNRVYYAGLPSATMHRAVGDYLRHAIENKYITEDDLYTTDQDVLDKTTAYHASDEMMSKLFERMNNRIKAVNDPSDYNAHVFCKSRVVDPYFMEDSKLIRVSERDADWAKRLQEELKPKEYFIKFES